MQALRLIFALSSLSLPNTRRGSSFGGKKEEERGVCEGLTNPFWRVYFEALRLSKVML